MQEYEMIRRLGGGSFADVYLEKEKSTGELVAIKVLKKKYRKFDDCVELREVKSLQKLQKDSLAGQKGIDNIIKLKQIVFEKKTGTLNLVFEYMETDLYELMKKRSPGKLSEEEIKDITYQTLCGLFHMHKYGFFHRDMKPENLLLTGKKVKIGDFGLAREIRSIPPYTEYVSTRYYRAPECILRSTNYNSPIDIWAMGCIMAEMYMHPMPLFYGSNEKEVFNKICSLLGSPTHDSWLDGIAQAQQIGFKIPNNVQGTDLSNIVKGASPLAIDLMKQMLKWDPNCRASAATLLKHPFFKGMDMKRVTNSNFFNDFGDVKNFNTTNRRFRPNDEKNDKNEKNEVNEYYKKEGGNDDNTFSKVLNDTEGFNKFLNELKKEENEDNKNFEKNNKGGKNDYSLNNLLGESFYNRHAKDGSNNGNNNKKSIVEEKENESDSEDEKPKKEEFKITRNKDEFKINRNKNDFNFDNDNNSKKKSNEYDYLFGNKKLNDFDTNIDQILQKEITKANNPSNYYRGIGGLGYQKKDTNNNFYHNKNENIEPSSIFGYPKAKSQIQPRITKANNIDLGSNPLPSRLNLKPIVSNSRRVGGGLCAIGYEPNKNSNFNVGLGAFNFNKDRQFGGFKEQKPVIMKDDIFSKKEGGLFGYNNRSEVDNKNRNPYARNDKFSSYERSNPLVNQFQKDSFGGIGRRKRNYFSQNNNNNLKFNWEL